MSEPTSSLSILSLATRISKEAGIAYRGVSGTSRAMPPVDKDDLEDIKQVINDGIRQFESDAPPTGWEWRKRVIQVNISNLRVTGTADSATATTIVDATLATTYTAVTDLVGYYCYITGGTGVGSYAKITGYDPTGTPGEITVADWLDQYGNAGGTDPAASSTFAITQYETVAGDVGRYPLPEYYGGEISGDINYDKDSVHTQRILWTAENIIRKRRQNSGDTGYPFMAAIRQLEPAALTPTAVTAGQRIGPKRRQELIVYPDPIQVDILEWPYILAFDKIDMETGVVDSASTTTIVDATRDEADDYFNGWRVDIIDGTGRGSYAIVTDYAGGTFTVADWLKADGSAGGTDPAADSVYVAEPLNNLHPAGMKFDEVVKASCLSEAEQFFGSRMRSEGHIERYIQKALPKAYEADARSRMYTKIGRQRPFNRTWQYVTKVTTS